MLLLSELMIENIAFHILYNYQRFHRVGKDRNIYNFLLYCSGLFVLLNVWEYHNEQL